MFSVSTAASCWYNAFPKELDIIQFLTETMNGIPEIGCNRKLQLKRCWAMLVKVNRKNDNVCHLEIVLIAS